jgi:hypothetical protein
METAGFSETLIEVYAAISQETAIIKGVWDGKA